MSNYNVSHEFCIYCICGKDIVFLDSVGGLQGIYKCLGCGNVWSSYTFWNSGMPVRTDQ